MHHLSESCRSWEVQVSCSSESRCLLLFICSFSLFDLFSLVHAFDPSNQTVQIVHTLRVILSIALAFIWPLKPLYKGQVRAKEHERTTNSEIKMETGTIFKPLWIGFRAESASAVSASTLSASNKRTYNELSFYGSNASIILIPAGTKTWGTVLEKIGLK